MIELYIWHIRQYYTYYKQLKKSNFCDFVTIDIILYSMARSKDKKRKLHIKLPAKLSTKQKEAVYKYLDNIYYAPSSGGGYSSAGTLLKEVKRRGYYTNLGLHRIRHYLNKQNAYSLYRTAHTKFPTPPVRVTRFNQQIDMDLMDVSRYQSDNDGVRYLLSAICVFSKQAYLEPLKTKEGGEVARAAAKILDARPPGVRVVSTDRGSEFRSAPYQQLLQDRGIHHFYAGGSGKAVTVERFHRTIRSIMAKYMFRKNSKRYLEALDDLLAGYNKRYHTSIKMRPIDVNQDNEDVVYRNLYEKKLDIEKPDIIPYQFKVGDSVRISGEKHPFRREFFERWSFEVFKVSKRWRQNNINMYKIKDCSGTELTGSFYAAELSKVTESESALYIVDKYLDEKVENGRKYVKIHWQGYPRECATWELKSKVTSAH